VTEAGIFVVKSTNSSGMFPAILLSIIIAYFGLLMGIAWYTSRHSDNESFFIGNRSSKWWLVAFGMVGTSLSGMTFISVPGTVGTAGFDYFQVILGNWLGYFVVAFVLLPLYYRLNLASIYTYLDGRLGKTAYKTGAFFFIISRTMGATLRLYLVIKVMELFILQQLGVSFEITTVVILALILLYTYRGGVKTIVWTDTLQTTFMLLALVVCLVYMLHSLHWNVGGAWTTMQQAGYTHIWNMDFQSKGFFLKQLLGGMFITITMTGLDQEMMQKNISVSNVRGSQKNMITLSFLMVLVVFIFLALGGILYCFAINKGAVFQTVIVDGKSNLQLLLNGKNIIGDNIFPTMAFQFMPPVVSIIFIIGLISALFPSADGALTALTSSFCIDILGIRHKHGISEKQLTRTRHTVHYTFALVFLLCIFLLRSVDHGSLVNLLLTIAGYTYGPLLALFAFGLLTRRKLMNRLIPAVCLAGPAICYLLKQHDTQWLGGYTIGLELLPVNALITFALLAMISTGKHNSPANT